MRADGKVTLERSLLRKHALKKPKLVLTDEEDEEFTFQNSPKDKKDEEQQDDADSLSLDAEDEKEKHIMNTTLKVISEQQEHSDLEDANQTETDKLSQAFVTTDKISQGLKTTERVTIEREEEDSSKKKTESLADKSGHKSAADSFG